MKIESQATPDLIRFSDDTRSTCVSLSGRGEIDEDAQRIERLWSPFHRAAFPDGPDSRCVLTDLSSSPPVIIPGSR